MNRIRIIIILIISSPIFFNVVAQNILSPTTRNMLIDAEEIRNGGKVSFGNGEVALFSRYALYKEGATIYTSGLIKVDGKIFDISSLQGLSAGIGSRLGDIISISLPLENVELLSKTAGIRYIELGRKIIPELDGVIVDTRTDSVHLGLNLPQSYTGEGVVIAVTDWGFDYGHPVFYDTSFNNLRITRVWDQFRKSGPPPAGFNYGTELAGQAEILQAAHDTFNVYGNHTHGTHVAGIAAGNGGSTKYKGVAPGAELVLISIVVSEAAVMDAYLYAAQYASSVQKRLVVNMSWGLYHMGTLDGTSLLSELLDSLSLQGVVFVSSAGNNGDVNFHIKKTFADNQDTLKTRIEFDNWSGANTLWGSAVIIWGEKGHSFRTAIEVTNTSNQLLGTTVYYFTDENPAVDSFMVCNSDTIFYKLFCDSSNLLNQKPHMLLKIRNAKSGTYKVNLKMISDSGTVHLWNVAELQNGVGNWGLAFTAPLSGFTAGNNQYGIGEPSCTESVISVAAYKTEKILSNGNPYGGNIAAFSSRGPTADERMKPDITAPGVSVVSSMSSYYPGTYIATATQIFNGRTYKFSALSGTSMSGPVVAGVAALILEANPWLTSYQVKEVIKNTARTDTHTGLIPAAGSTIWGAGKVNAYDAVKYSINHYAGINSEDGIMVPEILIYPNPARDLIYIAVQEDFATEEIILFDLSGRILLTLKAEHSDKGVYTLNLQGLSSGYYMAGIRAGNIFRFAKVLKI